jgi:4-amino-4-deoxychorismate lyase
MSRLLESIKVHDGVLYNLEYHQDRMQRAWRSIFGIHKTIDLARKIKVPKRAKQGLFKCRIVYDLEIIEIDFAPYKRKEVHKIKWVEDEKMSYSHKFENRDHITAHTQKLKAHEELIFIKGEMLRDASYSNIALFNGRDWHTPSYPLLKGTKRAELLEKGMIISKKIRPEHLKNYQRISFINALNDLNEMTFDL